VNTFGWVFLGVLLLLGSWSLAGQLVLLPGRVWRYVRWWFSACQWLFSSRPFSGREVTSTCSLPGEGVHDGPSTEQPHPDLPSDGALHSSPPPACSCPAPRWLPCNCRPDAIPVLGVPLAAIDPSPHFGAFTSGVEIIVFTALFTISSLLVVGWIVKTMRSSK
jgi:hypothetical protein